jgi:hypothetical protein
MLHRAASTTITFHILLDSPHGYVRILRDNSLLNPDGECHLDINLHQDSGIRKWSRVGYLFKRPGYDRYVGAFVASATSVLHLVELFTILLGPERLRLI